MKKTVLVAIIALGACDTSLAVPDAGVDTLYGWNPDGGVRYHPGNYGTPAIHGVEMTMQKQDCRVCHGATLTGGFGPSCDLCHSLAKPGSWRTDCTYCHGGGDNMTGAPPRNIDGNVGGNEPFPVHTPHVVSTLTSTLDCMQCHVKATEVMSPNHAFDTTPGRAETDFGAGKSKQAVWDGNGTCSNVYCHGTGRGDDGVIHTSDGKRDCNGCHPGQTAGAAAWVKMSGAHELHESLGDVTCADCHQATTTDGTTVAAPALHIDGLRQVVFTPTAPGFTWDAATQTCTGTCHNYAHGTFVWLPGTVGGRFHPPGYNAPTMHGPDMELQRMDCRGCHGATLMGSGAAPSCDSCHKAGWRTNCVYCHGGTSTPGGAPPRDLAATLPSTSQSFVAHNSHVTTRIMTPLDCTQCHTQPTDVLSPNHSFDSTPAHAEVALSGGGSYAAGTCSNVYCHGNGRTNGSITDGAPALGCGGCHSATTKGLSGAHNKHNNYGCATCHLTTTTNGTSIATPAIHIDGLRQVVFNLTGIGPYDPSTGICAGSCHGENHNDKTW